MKLLFVTPFLRVPADFGFAIRNYHILRHLFQQHEVLVVTYGPDQTGQTDAWITERGGVCLRLPFAFPWSSEKHGYWSTLKRIYTYPTSSFQRFAPQALAKRLQGLLTQHANIDLILFDTQLMGQALLHRSFGKPCVLVLHDIYEVAWRRQLAEVGVRPYAVVYAAEWLKTSLYERRILRHFQHLVTVSSNDHMVLKKRRLSADVALFPNGVDTSYFTADPSSGYAKTLLFVGTFGYPPNADAFLYFYQAILPLIRAKYPQVQFMAVGHYPSAEMKAIAALDAGIVVTGSVEDVRPYYAQASVVVVPLRAGGGLKLKTLEAFAMGTPVVSTPVGSEGIAAQDGVHYLQAETPAAFADRVIWLFEHPNEALAMAQRARQLVEERYDWRAIACTFEGYLNGIAGETKSNHAD